LVVQWPLKPTWVHSLPQAQMAQGGETGEVLGDGLEALEVTGFLLL
jgi:hypothetical protein